MTQINPNFCTKTIGDLHNLNFFIDEYQRGYKWTALQVQDLLDDINSFDKGKDIFYCLQPLALKTMETEKVEKYFSKNISESYEVIDGQQRLTTVFIILELLGTPLYNICYQTRKESADFLLGIKEKIGNLTISPNNSVPGITKAIEEEWKKFVGKHSDWNNIDIFYFFGAYVLINSWLKEKTEEEKKDFQNKLTKCTRFIWYVDNSTDNSKVVFRNLNSGKISLTNAELIKAMFVNKLKCSNREVQALQQNNLAGEWDLIEQELQKDSFWYFINNDTDSNKYQTRIDFLFELDAKDAKDKKDKLYTYRYYANNPEKLNWDRIKKKYLKLKEWYSDRSLYHLIGYIIDRNFKTIDELVTLSEEKSKDDFEKKLCSIIDEILFQAGGLKKLDSINFEDNYKEVTNTLLLFNIQEFQNSVSGFRFPFDQFKNTKWTIEHIHAQNAEDLKTYDEIGAWVSDIEKWKEEIDKRIAYLKKQVPESSELKKLTIKANQYESDFSTELKDIKEKLKEQDGAKEISKDIKGKVSSTMELTKEFMDVHKLGNLALLDGPTNSGLGNKSFPKKREYLLEVDKIPWDDNDLEKKRFVPLATKHVFLKYYTENVDQYEFWGYQDRSDYLSTIKNKLKDFLKLEASHE